MRVTAYIENIAILVCFTTLAIVFKHWWIVLVGILILNIPKESRGAKWVD